MEFSLFVTRFFNVKSLTIYAGLFTFTVLPVVFSYLFYKYSRVAAKVLIGRVFLFHIWVGEINFSLRYWYNMV